MLITYIYLLLILTILAKIAYLDYKERLIADFDIFMGLLIVFFYKAFIGIFIDAMLGSIVLGGIYFVFFLVVKKLYNQENLGAGDVTLMILLGSISGLSDLGFLMLWGNVLVCVVVFALLITKKKTLADPIPMAPFYIPIVYIFLLKDFFSFI